MSGLGELIDAIDEVLWANVSAPNLPEICSTFGMTEGDESESYSSKRAYVRKRITGWGENELVQLAKRVHEMYPSDSLQLLVERFAPDECFQISSITRQHLIDQVPLLGQLEGKLDLLDFLGKLWDIQSMPSKGGDFRCSTVADDISQHMIRNNDYSYVEMLTLLDVPTMPNKKFAELLEWVVHPLVRVDAEQQDYVEAINRHLRHDGLVLVASEQMSGYPLFRLIQITDGVSGAAKNLIFASCGPKPEIVFADAVNNDIKIEKNAEFCLIYDQPISKDGLLWKHLIEWWAARTDSNIDDPDTERNLYRRLKQSLGSPPELLLFRAFFEVFRSRVGDRLPALIPQVYLHYDPYTASRLRGQKRLPRQRMDFLLLFSSYQRVVIEVDGKQHYSEGADASPSKYAEMVGADRDLRLSGYEVYRFGAAELNDSVGKAVVGDFFTKLFEKHGIYGADAQLRQPSQA